MAVRRCLYIRWSLLPGRCVGAVDDNAAPDAEAEGGMLYDAFGNSGLADAFGDSRFWNVRYRMENLWQKEMTASALAKQAVIL